MSPGRAVEHHITVSRTARYYTLGPPGANDVWFVLHGYAQLARYFIRSFAPIDDGSRLIIGPEALNRYYFESRPGAHTADARVAATWMTREDREYEVADYVGYLDTLAARATSHGRADPAGAAAPTITVLGFSQGAATASRWAARGGTRIDRLILWGAGAAHDLTPAPRLFQGARLVIAVGRDDPHVTEQRITAEHERLVAGGLVPDLFRYDGGHGVEAQALLQLVGSGHLE